jgi:hypothetical protein
MKAYIGRIMRGSVLLAFCVAGLFAMPAAGAFGSNAAPAAPLDLTSYTTVADQPGSSSFANQFDLGLPELPMLSYGPPVRGSLNGFDTAGHVTILDNVSLGFGVTTDVATRVNPGDAANNNDALFFSAPALNGPYASLTNGGAFAAVNFDLTDDLHFVIGGTSLASELDAPTGATSTVARVGGQLLPYDMRGANSILAGINLEFGPLGGVTFTGSQTSEHQSVLGNFDPAVHSADTTALDTSAHLQLGGGWVTTASFSAGITKLDMKPGFGVASNDLNTRSYGLSVAKRGLFGNDAMGVAITRPAPGSADSEFALMSADDARPQFFAGNRLLDGQSPETDFEVGYVTTFLDGSVALQANAAYQVNFAGQSGTNAVSLLSRAKIKF